MAPAPANVAPPAWRAHLFALAPSEGYDPSALLTELGSESRPLFTIVDCETLVRESKDPDVVADLKACGGEVRGGMMAKCLVAKLAEDKAAGIEAKAVAIATAIAEKNAKAEACAAAVAAGEEVETEIGPTPESEPGPADGDTSASPKDRPPDVSRSADVYMLLKNFPCDADDAAAMAEAGIGLDSLVAMEIDSVGLAHALGTPLPEPPEGEEPTPPESLPPSPLLDGLTSSIGDEATGLHECVHMKIGRGLSAEQWASVPLLVAALADAVYAPVPPTYPHNI